MKFITAVLISMTMFSCGSRFKIHHVMKNRQILQQTNQIPFDMEEEWPFPNTIENGDPIVSELVKQEEDNETNSYDEGVRIEVTPASLFLSRVYPPTMSIFWLSRN